MTMPPANFEEQPEQAAADWVLRHDRGLSAAEQDEFSHWLAADDRHRDAFAVHRWGWEEMDRLAGIQTTVHALPDPDLLASPAVRSSRPSKIVWIGSLALAMAAALAVMFLRPGKTNTPAAAVPLVFAARIEQRTLDDGSVVELNRGAEIAVNFTPGERRVELLKGEASFQVAKNKERPFVVSAGGVDVRAVGTAFNVRLDSATVDVLVTEGVVGVERVAVPAGASREGWDPNAVQRPEVRPLHLSAGERTSVSLVAAAPLPEVIPVTKGQTEAILAWQPRLMDFTDAPLADIVAEFNRRNPVHLVLEQPVVGELRLSATFRSDNVEGFVRLMESDFDLRAEQRGNDILLRKAR